MKKLVLSAFGLMLMASPAFAQRDRHFETGDRLPREFRQDAYVFEDWRDAGLRTPPRGYQWMQVGDQYLLASRRDGKVADVVVLSRRDHDDRDYAGGRGRGDDDRNGRDDRNARNDRDDRNDGDDREARWKARYSRSYTMNDDRAYTECRNQPDPAGVLAGAFLGGILGNAAGGKRDSGGATIAGVIAGGAIGAALTNNMKCEDRSYAYDAYSRGFNGGTANARYEWKNPRNGDRGEMHVLDYYRDEDNFRCAVFTHTVYIGGRPQEARGRACQQPNGTWAIID